MTTKLLKLAQEFERMVYAGEDMSHATSEPGAYQDVAAPIFGVTISGGEANTTDQSKIIKPLFAAATKLVKDTSTVDIVSNLGGPNLASITVFLNGKPSPELTQVANNIALKPLKSAISTAITSKKLTPVQNPYQWKVTNFTIDF